MRVKSDVPVKMAVQKEASFEPVTCPIELLATGGRGGHTDTAIQIPRRLNFQYVGYLVCLSANNMTVAFYAVDILMSRIVYYLICLYVLVV